MPEIDFDANEIPESNNYEAIPAGDYLAEIDSSAMKETKAKNGEYLELVFKIIDGPYNGRLIWLRLTMKHATSPKAVEIGKQQLAQICRAVGVMHVRASEELHGIPLWIKVAVRERDDASLENDIKKFAAAGPGSAPAPQPQPQRGPAVAARPAAAPPAARPAAARPVTPPAAQAAAPARTSAPWANTPRTSQPNQAPPNHGPEDEDIPF